MPQRLGRQDLAGVFPPTVKRAGFLMAKRKVPGLHPARNGMIIK